MTHTPTPWAAREGFAGDWEVYPLRDGPPDFGEWSEVARVEADYGDDDGEEGKANAEFIVRAVNCHDELVAAARRVLSWVAPIAGDNRDGGAADEEMASVEALEIALARATPTTSLKGE